MLVKIASHISWQKVYEKVFIIDETCNCITSIEDIAMEIWCMIDRTENVKDIVDYLCENYCVDKDEVCNDVDEFILEMAKKGYLISK